MSMRSVVRAGVCLAILTVAGVAAASPATAGTPTPTPVGGASVLVGTVLLGFGRRRRLH